MISSKILKEEGWIAFEKEEYIFLDEKTVDELALDTYKWMLKLNVKKLKENKAFMKRVETAKKRKNK